MSSTPRCRCADGAVQKWHTSSRKISLRPTICLAKINHAGWRGLSCWRLHTCTDHHSRWLLLCCALRPPRPATCHPSTWRRAEFYAPSADVYVRPGPTYRQPPYAEPGYGYRQPSYGTPSYPYRAPASVYGEYGPAYAAQPAYVERAPAYPERSYAPERSTLRIATTRRNATMRWNMHRDRLCPCPTVRGRDATTAMAGGPTAIKPPALRRDRHTAGRRELTRRTPASARMSVEPALFFRGCDPVLPSPHSFDLIPEERALARVSKDAPRARAGPAWFETALARLLTMRVEELTCDKFNTTGKSLLIFRNRVKPRKSKIFRFTLLEIRIISFAIPAHTRGVSRSSRCVGLGLRWTLWRQACFSRRTKTPKRTAKSCGPGAAMLALSLWEVSAGDGDNKPAHRGEHEVSRKAIAQGMSECFRSPVCSCAPNAQFLAHETAGAARTRHSLRPLF